MTYTHTDIFYWSRMLLTSNDIGSDNLGPTHPASLWDGFFIAKGEYLYLQNMLFCHRQTC